MHALRKDYRTEAQACPSPDGRRVVFASTWDSPTGRPIGCYVIDTRAALSERGDRKGAPLASSR